MSLSKPKRKVDDEHRQFQERWTLQYFFVEFGGNAICLICKEKLAVLKEYNLKRHYTTKHGEQYEKYSGDDRKRRAEQQQRGLVS